MLPIPTAFSGRRRGFILIYVLWMVAALVALVAMFAGGGRFRQVVGDEALAYELEARQALTILDYVLRYSQDFDPKGDPRFAAYKSIAEERAAELAAADDRLAFLKALLSSMNFKIDVDDKKKAEEKKSGGPAAGTGTGTAAAVPDGKEKRRFVPRAEPYSLELGETRYQIAIEQTNRRLNLNRLPPDQMARFLAVAGFAEADANRIADVVADWIDTDENPRLRGAETGSQDAPMGYRTRNAAFQSWAEVAMAADMTPDRVQFLRQNFTLWGKDGKVLVEALSPAAIAAMTQLPEPRVRAGLALMRSPQAIGLDTPLLDEKEEKLLFGLLTTTFDESVVRITVTGPRTRIEAWVDPRQRLLLDWCFC